MCTCTTKSSDACCDELLLSVHATVQGAHTHTLSTGCADVVMDAQLHTIQHGLFRCRCSVDWVSTDSRGAAG